MNYSPSFKNWLIITLFIPLSACISVGGHEQPAKELYVLKAQPMAVGGAIPVSIMVAEPEAASGLDTKRIAVFDKPNHLTYYNGISWAQFLPEMFQGFMVDALSQSHSFKNVTSDEDSTPADINLHITLHDFEVTGTADNPAVQIRLDVDIINGDSQKPISTFMIRKTAVAQANHMPDIVAAFNQASNEIAADIARRVINACAGAAAKSCGVH